VGRDRHPVPQGVQQFFASEPRAGAGGQQDRGDDFLFARYVAIDYSGPTAATPEPIDMVECPGLLFTRPS